MPQWILPFAPHVALSFPAPTLGIAERSLSLSHVPFCCNKHNHETPVNVVHDGRLARPPLRSIVPHSSRSQRRQRQRQHYLLLAASPALCNEDDYMRSTTATRTSSITSLTQGTSTRPDNEAFHDRHERTDNERTDGWTDERTDERTTNGERMTTKHQTDPIIQSSNPPQASKQASKPSTNNHGEMTTTHEDHRDYHTTPACRKLRRDRREGHCKNSL